MTEVWILNQVQNDTYNKFLDFGIRKVPQKRKPLAFMRRRAETVVQETTSSVVRRRLGKPHLEQGRIGEG